jgi:hypothetical protein
MTEKLKFHFPIATLLRDGGAIITAAETHTELGPRLRGGILNESRALLGSVPGGDNTKNAKKGAVGTLTKAQNDLLAKLTKWVSRAKETAGLAFKGQTVKLREEFQVGIFEPYDLASVVRRAGITLASMQNAANAQALKDQGWIDADNTAFETVLSGLGNTDLTQEIGKGDAKGATGIRNHDANILFDNLLAIQNAAGLQWPDDDPANSAVRDEFRLDTFPPQSGNGGTTDQPPTPPAPPTPPTTPAK